MIDLTKSDELLTRARRIMPGGHSNLRAPLTSRPIFFARGKGARLWDVDGNEYIDYINAAGPGLLGHDNEEFTRAVSAQLKDLCIVGSGVGQIEAEIELIEKMVKYIPCAEQVRLCLAGTEVVQLAIRLARAYTHRPCFIRFEGHYHGSMDNILGGEIGEVAAGRPVPVETAEDHLGTEGRAPGSFEPSLMLPWNDIAALEEALEEYHDQVALVMMEPIACNGGCLPPRPGYLERVRELCTSYGIVFMLDEIITGFRVGLGGAQAELGVTPDIATYGKALGGGLPVSALAGKKEIMDLLLERRVIGAGTFNGYPLATAAALATIKVLEQGDAALYEKRDKLQERLKAGLAEITARRDIPCLIQGEKGTFFTHFLDFDGEMAYSVRDLAGVDHERGFNSHTRLTEEGVITMFGARWYISMALTETDVDETLERADKAFARL